MPGDLTETLSPLLRNTLEQERRADIQNTGDYGQSMGEMYGTFFGLPELRGFWPMSSLDEVPKVYDLGGQGRTLTAAAGLGYAAFNNLVPYALLNGTNQNLTRANETGLQITGALTFGGWMWIVATPANTVGYISKYTDLTNLRSWMMFVDTTPTINFIVSSDGTAANSKSVASATVTTGAWHFVVARYTPSTELAIFVDGVKVVNTTSIPAALFNTTADFEIGAYNASAAIRMLNARIGPSFVCAFALSDSLLTYLFARTRAIFGV